MAQSVARLTGGQEAVGSSPVIRTKIKDRIIAVFFDFMYGIIDFCNNTRYNSIMKNIVILESETNENN